MDRPALEGLDRIFHKPGFINGVRVNGHLDVIPFCDAEARIDGGRSRPPILVQLQADRPRFDLLVQAFRQ